MNNLVTLQNKSLLAELRILRKEINKQAQKLSRYEDCYLKPSSPKKRKNKYFYLKQKGVKKSKYLGPESNETVQEIKCSKYFGEALRIIDRDIELLEKFDSEFVPPEHDVINERLPESYRFTTHNPLSLVAPSQTAREWKARKEAEKARHEPYKPDELKYEATDGTMMRSYGEVLIANYLISLGITFVYELPLQHHGERILPDFTILSPVDNKTVIIIEHQGAMGSEAYQKKHIRSLIFYLKTNLVPNKNLFFTYAHMNGNVNLQQIDAILFTAFGFEKAEVA